MLQRAVRFVQYGQFCFLLCCSWCLLIEPASLVDSSGLSFYGNFQATLLPYLIGFGAMAYCMLHAAHLLKNSKGAFVDPIRLVLLISAICTVGILVTPSFGPLPVRVIHFVCATVLFMSQLWLGCKLVMGRYGIHTVHFIFVMQVASCIAVVLSYRRIALLHLMVPAQVAAGLAFSILVTRTLNISARKQPEVSLPPAIIEDDVLTEEPSGSS